MLNKYLLLIAFAVLVVSCNNPKKAENIAIIPQPVEIKIGEGTFCLSKNTKISILNRDSIYMNSAKFIANIFGNEIVNNKLESNVIVFESLNSDKAEAYKLNVTTKQIVIQANDASGAFYAIQTLLQLLPAEVFGGHFDDSYAVPVVDIFDYPRFSWRGMHLDCSRHFFTVNEVKRYIDYLAMHKMNRFHWHLTDDQGWRMESKRYPLLTQKSAWRIDRSADDWNARKPMQRGEKATYGGFYSQDEIRDIIAYAKERAVVIMPEIEIPGHSAAVFASYPELSCLGKEQSVTPGGYYPVDMATCYCAGNENVFTFLEGILDEVIELFPDAPYIHIGGDEVDKFFWNNCPKCQKRIKNENLKNVDELQSYFIKRIANYVNAKGKQIIGWDEILEGGLAPNATVMSWRGVAGGIKAVEMGHDVVMTPNSHLYFDYYQNNPEVEPKSIGGFITVKKVYNFEPISESFTVQQAKHILGVQANLWCEFIPTFSHVEYMVLPRMSAISEVGWSVKESKDYDGFIKRLLVQHQRYKAMGANSHKGADYIDFTTKYDSLRNVFTVKMDTEFPEGQIYYTLDNSEPTIHSTRYSKPIEITSTTKIIAVVVKNNEVVSQKPTERVIGMHKGVGKKIKYNLAADESYPGMGDRTLLDGFTGYSSHSDGFMQGFVVGDFDVEIDFGAIEKINSISLSCFQSVGSWIYLPTEVIFYQSNDGKVWDEIGKVEYKSEKIEQQVRKMFTISKFISTQYIRIVGVNGITPNGLPGAGLKNWIFVDEVFIQ